MEFEGSLMIRGVAPKAAKSEPRTTRTTRSTPQPKKEKLAPKKGYKKAGVPAKHKSPAKPLDKQPVKPSSKQPEKKKILKKGPTEVKKKELKCDENDLKTPDVENKEEEIQPVNPQTGITILRYNHYRHEFEITVPPGTLSVEDVNERFCFSYGFKGNYKIQLREGPESGGGPYAERNETNFCTLKLDTEYWCEIDEDKEWLANEEKKGPKKVYKAPTEKKTTRETERITQQLKSLSADELRAQGAEYKQMIEARDVEDILYGGGS
eukprot:m.136365 g.136365  ORF g.136365 m.136365 type:complete len:266 (+) comp14731_c0_seq1:1812-2609(+)